MEGILVFHDARVRDLMNMKIFVDTGPLCLPTLLEIIPWIQGHRSLCKNWNPEVMLWEDLCFAVQYRCGCQAGATDQERHS